MKQCPYCGEEIQDEAIKCRYCREWLAPRPEEPAPVPAVVPQPTAEGGVVGVQPEASSPDVEAEIRRLLQAGDVILPIKRLREAVPELGLAEAKSIVEKMQTGKSLAQALAEQQYSQLAPPPRSSGCALSLFAVLVALAGTLLARL